MLWADHVHFSHVDQLGSYSKLTCEQFFSLLKLLTCMFEQIAIFASLTDGKIFREWVSPAVLKAYQWQVLF